MATVLLDMELQKKFREFLEAEFSEETLLFWNEVESFNSMIEYGLTVTVIALALKQSDDLGCTN